jgi:hypothetical protein
VTKLFTVKYMIFPSSSQSTITIHHIPYSSAYGSCLSVR